MFVRKKRYEALKKKYDELCAMDCQKLYGDERIKRERAEMQAAALKAKADAADELRQILNGWVATIVERVGEVTIPAEVLKKNLADGSQTEIAYDQEKEEYRLRPAGAQQCTTE